MSDAPPPALGELARLATEAQKAIDEYTALYHRAPPLGGALYSEFCRDLSAACSPAVILQLVALASGGAADTARLDWLSAGNEARSAPYGYAVWCGERDDSTAGSSLRAAIDAASSLTPERPADAD